MKKTLILLLTFVFMSSFVKNAHETYLSVTEVEYNSSAKTIQIISRVFTDDLEDVLSKRYQKEVSLSYKKDLELNEGIIQRYLNQKFRIKVDGNLVELNLLGARFDADQVVLFIESGKVQGFGKVEVENLILTDLFDDQKNIVHVKKGEKIESMLLRKAKSRETVHF